MPKEKEHVYKNILLHKDVLEKLEELKISLDLLNIGQVIEREFNNWCAKNERQIMLEELITSAEISMNRYRKKITDLRSILTANRILVSDDLMKDIF